MNNYSEVIGDTVYLNDMAVMSRIPIYDYDVAKNIMVSKQPDTFIYQKDNSYFLYRRYSAPYKDPLSFDDEIIDDYQLMKFNCLSKAIICGIDDEIWEEDLEEDFDSYKNEFGNLAHWVVDKRKHNELNDLKDIDKNIKGVKI